MMRLTCLMIASFVAASPVMGQKTVQNIPVSSFTASTVAVEGYNPFRASYDGASDDYILMPNESTPHRTFGWLEGPRFQVNPAAPDAYGAVAGITVEYTFNPAFQLNAPELRVRLNSSNFHDYGVSGVPHNQLHAQRGAGRGTVTALIDRRNLSAVDNLRVYIDFFSHWEQGQVDPNFFLRIDRVEVFSVDPAPAQDRSQLISAAYMESDGDVYVHIGGSTSRVRIRSTASSYAYDGGYAITLDDRDLHGYSVQTGMVGYEIANDNVVSAALSDRHVIYLELDGDVYYFNIVTKEERKIGSDEDYILVTSADDGTLLVGELGTNGLLRYHYLDTNVSSPTLQRLTDEFEIKSVHTRDTWTELTSKRNSLRASSEWTLLE